MKTQAEQFWEAKARELEARCRQLLSDKDEMVRRNRVLRDRPDISPARVEFINRIEDARAELKRIAVATEDEWSRVMIERVLSKL